MIQLDQLKIELDKDGDLNKLVAEKLKVKTDDIIELSILKKSIDARKKPLVFFVYSVAVKLKVPDEKILKSCKKNNNVHLYQKKDYSVILNKNAVDTKIAVVGAGPAGLFCSYLLALAGLHPVIFERGKKVEDRTKDIIKFWETGVLDTSSNVQFGEGGAGTFSDGKLNTLVNDKFGRNKFVLETFVKFGAPLKILYEGKPHIGTDILKNVIANMRMEIQRLGGEFHFNSRVSDFEIINGKITGLYVEDKLYKFDKVILAIGHSARDTFYKLNDLGISMEAKDFAVGFRIEHPQDMISRNMYGEAYKKLEPAPYKLTCNLESGRGIYSFCMCPGGFVVNSSSEENRLVVNGMSYSKRDSLNANSAIVVSVGAKEFDKSTPLAGIEYQRKIEEKAFNLCNGKIPQQLYGDFKAKRLSLDFGEFNSQCKGNNAFGMLNEIYSDEINNSIITAMDTFNGRIKDFDRYDAILSGVESRTSSPVRINRDEFFVSNIDGLYPCGEGAGFAGGITSAAMDGMKVAEAVLASINN